ncbi:MAG: peptide ABC transporter substrate-binding protein [Chloroflexi bacterium]|nr:peptide ABC transporter substrate-binding protein [Chloroflexota bacterium]
MFTNKKTIWLALLIVFGLAVAACQPQTEVQTVEVTRVVTETVVETVVEEGETIEVTRVVTETVVETVTVEVAVESEEAMEDHPVTLYWNFQTEPPSADPALATDTTSVDLAGNMFVGLTKFDPVTGEIQPYLATDWETGEDADGNQTWTFNMRDDVAWINYDPVTGETTQEVDADGNPRFANAHDVVYGVKRTLDPATASDYAYVLYIIKNGQAVNEGSEEVTLDDVGVVALDDYTVQFTLENPAGFFPAIAGMWIADAQPQWAIEEYGDKWTEAGFIVTNGPYAMESWIHGGQLNLVKNPLWVNVDDVQIERIEGVMVTEDSTAFAMYENNELDTTGVPLPEIDRVKADATLSTEFFSAPTPCTYYYGFNNQKYPFTDVRVRTAFAQSIDRQSLIDNVTKGGQTPATSFAPPGMFGAPVPGTIGLQYDTDAAKASLQAFLDEEGITIDEFNELGVTLMHNTSEGHASIAAAIQQMWADNLGVTVGVDNQEWAVYLDTIGKTTPIEEAPHVFRLGWCADYPDENNWVHEVFNSDAGANRLRRNCTDANCNDAGTSEFDDLTVAAGTAQDPAEREVLYAQAEEILAVTEAAYAPIYHYTTVNVTKPWLTRNFPPLGANDFFNWTIDQAAQQGN